MGKNIFRKSNDILESGRWLRWEASSITWNKSDKSVELKAFVDTIGIKSADLKLFNVSDMFVRNVGWKILSAYKESDETVFL